MFERFRVPIYYTKRFIRNFLSTVTRHEYPDYIGKV